MIVAKGMLIERIVCKGIEIEAVMMDAFAFDLLKYLMTSEKNVWITNDESNSFEIYTNTNWIIS